MSKSPLGVFGAYRRHGVSEVCRKLSSSERTGAGAHPSATRREPFQTGAHGSWAVGTPLKGVVIIMCALLAVALSASWFTSVGAEDLEVYPSPYVSRVTWLSEYNPNLAGTAGDTKGLMYEGDEPGGTLLVVGGTHGDEAAGPVAALVFAENAHVKRGRLIVIPYVNASGFTHNLPQEAHPREYRIPTPNGDRIMPYGARLSNPVHQWPDPTVYVEPIMRQKLAGSESRNLNRAYPGREKGPLTSMIAYAVMELIRRENVDVAIDMHESSPEYPTNNTIVAHDRAMDIAVMASMDLESQGIEINIEQSPRNLRGLSHREWGDHTNAYAFLLECPNPAQGRLRGRTNAQLVVSGKDPMYAKATGSGRLYVPYSEEGISLSVRAGRHVASVMAISAAFSMVNPDREIAIEGIPSYADIVSNGVGQYLAASKGQRPASRDVAEGTRP